MSKPGRDVSGGATAAPLPAEPVRDPEEQARDVEAVNRQLREGLEQCGRDDGTEAAEQQVIGG